MKILMKIIGILAVLAGLCLLVAYILTRRGKDGEERKGMGLLRDKLLGRRRKSDDKVEIMDYRDVDDDEPDMDGVLSEVFDDAEDFFAGIDGSDPESEAEAGLSEDALEQLLDSEK